MSEKSIIQFIFYMGKPNFCCCSVRRVLNRCYQNLPTNSIHCLAYQTVSYFTHFDPNYFHQNLQQTHYPILRHLVCFALFQQEFVLNVDPFLSQGRECCLLVISVVNKNKNKNKNKHLYNSSFSSSFLLDFYQRPL